MAVAFAQGNALGRSVRAATSTHRCRVVKVSCHSHKGLLENVQLATAALATAALLHAAPADAGVVYESKPVMKKLFQETGVKLPAAKKELRLPGQGMFTPSKSKSTEEKKKTQSTDMTGDLDPRFIAVPASAAFIAATAFAASKLDPDFKEFIRVASVKDSNEIGAGYEPALDEASAGYPGNRGTKKVKSARPGPPSKPSPKKGSFPGAADFPLNKNKNKKR